jgi:transposase
VIDAFVGRLDVTGLGFERAEAAETGRPGYDPRNRLKLYLYGYWQQIRSSRRLGSECQRNVELMWLPGRLCPDHKSIAEFRRVHSDGVTEAGAELIRFARSVGLVRGEWVAIDGSKFRAVSSARSVREALKRYLDELESADAQDEVVIDPSAVAAALEKLKKHSEPEAGFMRTGDGTAPAYNVQTAVDAEHALIVVQKVTRESNDTRSLQPMAEAAKVAVGEPQRMNVIADAGYSNGEQAEACEEKGILPHVPSNRTLNNQGDGTFFEPHRLPVPGTKRHVGLSGWPDPHPQTVSAQRSRRDLCSSTGGLRSLRPQGSLYRSFPAVRDTAPARSRAAGHGSAGHA